MKRSVSIGRRFLAEVRSQYEDWKAAFVREAFQNCADAPGVRNVHFTVETDGRFTTFRFWNDGEPMTREIIEGKLLTLGESGKEHAGTVGGFGRAKELLYFANESYRVESGSWVVSGEGCEYDLTPASYRHGTWSEVVLEGDHAGALMHVVRLCVGYSRFRRKVFLNGEELTDRTNNGRKRDCDFPWCDVYTNKSHSGLMLLRVGGIFMSSRKLWDYDGCVVVELLTSRDTLTSNRDGLKARYRWDLDEFVESISTNKRKAFKAREPKFTRYSGAKLSGPVTVGFSLDPEVERKNAPKAWSGVLSPELDGKLAALVRSGDLSVVAEFGEEFGGSEIVPGPKTLAAMREVGGSIPLTLKKPAPRAGFTEAYGGRVAVSHEFVIRNELCDSIKVPVYYDPGSGAFSSYAKWLTGVWAKLLIELHAMFEHAAEFSVGFIFDDETSDNPCEAAFEKSGERGNVYYVSPCRLNETAGDRDVKCLSPRWKRNDKWTLLAVAAHEFVHGLGYSRHNESYAAKLTDVLGRVLKEKSRFAHCFKEV